MRWRFRQLVLVMAALTLPAGACSSAGGGGSSESGDGASSAAQGAPPPPPPSAPIADLMDKTSMTAEARKLFLDARPRIEGMADLESNCSNRSGAHTLGCFLVVKECQTGGASGCSLKTQIHLLQIDRPDAHDLIYVSAAHEMLHAAYEQLPLDERLQVDRQLEAALPQLDQCRVETNLGAYADRVGADRMNELHSVLATEFAVLPPGLQSHFNRYFSNRQLVVSAHDRTLGNREQEICGLRSRLDQLEGQIGSLRRQLGSAGSVRAYNALVPRINALVRDQNRAADTHNRRVREYNRLLESIGGDPGALAPREAPATPAQ